MGKAMERTDQRRKEEGHKRQMATGPDFQCVGYLLYIKTGVGFRHTHGDRTESRQVAKTTQKHVKRYNNTMFTSCRQSSALANTDQLHHIQSWKLYEIFGAGSSKLGTNCLRLVCTLLIIWAFDFFQGT
jgi:hypothetical protein